MQVTKPISRKEKAVKGRTLAQENPALPCP